MAKLTKRMFTEGVALLTARWPNQAMPPELSAIYAEVLSVLTGEEFVAGVKRAVAECEFFPSAKQILELARPALPADVEAGAVFTQLLHDPHIRRHHPARGTWYDLEAVAESYGEAARLALIAIGGGTRLSLLTDDALPFVLREFKQNYVAFHAELGARGIVARLGAPVERPILAAPDARRRLAAPVPLADVAPSAVRDFRAAAAGDPEEP